MFQDSHHSALSSFIDAYFTMWGYSVGHNEAIFLHHNYFLHYN